MLVWGCLLPNLEIELVGEVGQLVQHRGEAGAGLRRPRHLQLSSAGPRRMQVRRGATVRREVRRYLVHILPEHNKSIGHK